VPDIFTASTRLCTLRHIVDDHSTDENVELAQELARSLPIEEVIATCRYFDDASSIGVCSGDVYGLKTLSGGCSIGAASRRDPDVAQADGTRAKARSEREPFAS
jgi:hypothetical protein